MILCFHIFRNVGSSFSSTVLKCAGLGDFISSVCFLPHKKRRLSARLWCQVLPLIPEHTGSYVSDFVLFFKLLISPLWEAHCSKYMALLAFLLLLLLLFLLVVRLFVRSFCLYSYAETASDTRGVFCFVLLGGG